MIWKWVLAFTILYSGQLLAQQQFSTGIETQKLGNTTILFKTSCANEQQGIQFIHVHENEATAVDAVYKMMDKYGRGCFVTWQSRGDRNISFKLGSRMYKFDPNRIYTSKGRKASLKANFEYSNEADSMVAAVANVFLRNYIDSQRLVVALHNNTDGGGLTIDSFRKGGPYARDAKKVHCNKAMDEDDFFLTTSLRIYNFIKSKGYSIVLQDNARVTDDGSLSVYAASKNISYLNIEAQHGHLEQQLQMMDVVQEMIDTLF